jgi:hypothetical protein
MAAVREELALKVKLLDEIAKNYPAQQEIQNAAARVRVSLQRFDEGVRLNSPTAADSAAQEIVEIVGTATKIVEQYNQPRPATPTEKIWSYVGIGVLGLVFIGLAWFFASYVHGVGFAKLATFEGTRPILVIAAIISTIAFGGALLLGSLFSSDGSFEDRFRHAREIFLVFSGVFGTVIGFYFGVGDSKSPHLVVDGKLEGTALVAHATGGTPPYKIKITFGPKGSIKTAESNTGWARFAFDMKSDNIVPLRVSASDRNNTDGSTIIETNSDELKKAGWLLPGDLTVEPDANKK